MPFTKACLTHTVHVVRPRVVHGGLCFLRKNDGHCCSTMVQKGRGMGTGVADLGRVPRGYRRTNARQVCIAPSFCSPCCCRDASRGGGGGSATPRAPTSQIVQSLRGRARPGGQGSRRHRHDSSSIQRKAHRQAVKESGQSMCPVACLTCPVLREAEKFCCTSAL